MKIWNLLLLHSLEPLQASSSTVRDSMILSFNKDHMKYLALMAGDGSKLSLQTQRRTSAQMLTKLLVLIKHALIQEILPGTLTALLLPRTQKRLRLPHTQITHMLPMESKVRSTPSKRKRRNEQNDFLTIKLCWSLFKKDETCYYMEKSNQFIIILFIA